MPIKKYKIKNKLVVLELEYIIKHRILRTLLGKIQNLNLNQFDNACTGKYGQNLNVSP